MLCLVICCWTVGKGVGQNTGKQPLAFEDFFHGKMEKISGIFPVYRDSAKVYMEIPEHLLGRELEIRAQVNKGFDMVARPLESMGVVYLQKVDGHSIYVQRRLFSERVANKNNELYEALCKSNKQPVDIVYPVVAYSAGGKGYIIDVTEMLKTGDDWFKVAAPQVRDQDVSRARITGVHEFPDGVSFTIHRMYGFSPERLLDNVIPPRGFLPLEIGCVVTLLPEREMRERFVDRRFGYHVISFLDYSQNPYRAEKDSIIRKWNLGITEGSREEYRKGKLVNPSHPLVFYIDTCCPSEFVPYIKEGVLAWNAAFEKAGFKNAIIAIEVTDSMEIDMDDVNYSVLTYAASTKANAMGPSILDPRSGEILEADIMWWHNVLNMLQEWITVQTGTVRPEARGIKLSDELMGDAMRFVACHEVGHSLGLRHNMMGSWAFPTDSLRSKSFTDRMNSTSSSIMDYARFNYVAQPGDGITALSPHIGPYDLFAIEYGYRWYGKETPEEEKDLLYDFLSRHTDRLYKYSEAQDVRDAVDPRAQNEDLGDDAVRSSQYGIANLKRIVPEIIKWTTTGEKGQTYEEASRLYYAVINQWNNYLYHVPANIGGIYMENTVVGDGQKTYTFVEKEKQQAALKFLLDEVLTYPKWLFDAEVGEYTYLLRNTPLGIVENAPTQVLKNAQSYILWDLLSNNRLVRMLENEAVNGKKAFTAVELMDGLHRSIFATTERGALPDVMTRALQKNFVDALITAAAESEGVKINKKLMDNHFLLDNQIPLCSCDEHAHRTLDSDRMGARRELNFYGSQLNRISDAISVKRGELLRIKDLLQSRLGTSDVATKYHYKDMILRINTALGI